LGGGHSSHRGRAPWTLLRTASGLKSSSKLDRL